MAEAAEWEERGGGRKGEEDFWNFTYLKVTLTTDVDSFQNKTNIYLKLM